MTTLAGLGNSVLVLSEEVVWPLLKRKWQIKDRATLSLATVVRCRSRVDISSSRFRLSRFFLRIFSFSRVQPIFIAHNLSLQRIAISHHDAGSRNLFSCIFGTLKAAVLRMASECSRACLGLALRARRSTGHPHTFWVEAHHVALSTYSYMRSRGF